MLVYWDAGLGPLESVGNPHFLFSLPLNDFLSEVFGIFSRMLLLFVVLRMRIQSSVVSSLGWVVWFEGTVQRSFLVQGLVVLWANRGSLFPSWRLEQTSVFSYISFRHEEVLGAEDLLSVLLELVSSHFLAVVVGITHVLIALLEQISKVNEWIIFIQMWLCGEVFLELVLGLTHHLRFLRRSVVCCLNLPDSDVICVSRWSERRQLLTRREFSDHFRDWLHIRSVYLN